MYIHDERDNLVIYGKLIKENLATFDSLTGGKTSLDCSVEFSNFFIPF